MKNIMLCLLAVVVLAALVFWILPAALHFLMGAALLAASAAVGYSVFLPYWRKNEARHEEKERARSERHAQKDAEKSLKAIENDLRAREKTPH